MFSRSLRGLVGQSMAGPRVSEPYMVQLLPGTTSWSPPFSGTYRAILKGPGGHSSGNANGVNVGSGGSGAHCEATEIVAFGQVIPCTIGSSGSEVDTTMTLSGRPAAVTAGAGKAGDNTCAGGIASGGDYMLNGTAGRPTEGNGDPGAGAGGGLGGIGATGGSHGAGGAGAPGTPDFPGGRGGNTANGAPASNGGFPGGGGAFPQAGVVANTLRGAGGDGVIYIIRVR